MIRQDEGGRHLDRLRWGLVPPWADDLAIGNRMINARAETVADKPAFRHRRCLIPSTGFYEWARSNGKQPHLFTRSDGSLFAFAGLWERWVKGGEPVESCTILTEEADAVVSPVHERMPVILDPIDYAAWLDPGLSDEGILEGLLRGRRSVALQATAVGRWVNDPRHDDARCLQP